MKRAPGSILIVDDNPNEQSFIKDVFRELEVKDFIYIASDGEEAIAFLTGQHQFGDRQKFPFPTFLLTDLKMPRINGFELLSFIKRGHFIIIPTIVWTVSNSEEDIQNSYLLGANAFHTKPASREGFLQLVKTIYEYWAEVALPSIDENGNLMRGEQTGKRGSLITRPKFGEP